MMIDPVALVIEILTKAGHTEVHEEITSKALSSPEYIVVQELTGTSPHIRYSDKPTIQIVVFCNEGPTQARSRSYTVVNDLALAHAKDFDNGGIHHIDLVLRPSRQDVANQPHNVVRIMFQVEIGLSSLEKWS